MIKTLRIPNEYRFVRAFALSVDAANAICTCSEHGSPRDHAGGHAPCWLTGPAEASP